MKTSLNLILGIAVLATLGGLATAEPTTIKGSKSNGSYREPAPDKSITGKVTQVNQKTGTYTVTANGKEYQVKFWDMKTNTGSKPPKLGDMVDVPRRTIAPGKENKAAADFQK